jgi:hypothetical protein
MQFNDKYAVKFAALFYFSIFSISACDTSVLTSESEPIYADVIFQSIQCRRSTSEANFEVVSSQQQLDLLLHEFNRQILGGKPQPYLIDFKSMNVLVLEMGYRPTAGYSLSLNEAKIRVKNNEAFVIAQWDEPPEDSMQAQVIISPCVIFTLPKGNYSKVTVDIHNKNRQYSVLLN